MLIKHLKIFSRRQYSRKVQENNNSMLLCVWWLTFLTKSPDSWKWKERSHFSLPHLEGIVQTRRSLLRIHYRTFVKTRHNKAKTVVHIMCIQWNPLLSLAWQLIAPTTIIWLTQPQHLNINKQSARINRSKHTNTGLFSAKNQIWMMFSHDG